MRTIFKIRPLLCVHLPLLLLLFLSCSQDEKHLSSFSSKATDKEINKFLPELKNTTALMEDSLGPTIKERFPPPPGFVRPTQRSNSFQRFLQDLPLKKNGASVKYYDGTSKPSHAYCAVVDLPIGNKDLHQCADAVMRLRADYLYQSGRKGDIKFNFTNGFPCSYEKWKQGYRIKVNGNKVWWIKSEEEKDDPETCWAYLEQIFMYAGTRSLSKELQSKPVEELEPGDVFIQGGSPGHAVIVVDIAVNKSSGQKVFMLAQSYMPAQEIQVLKNSEEPNLSPWYMLNFPQGVLETPEWTFSEKDLKAFVEN